MFWIVFVMKLATPNKQKNDDTKKKAEAAMIQSIIQAMKRGTK